MGVRGPWGAVRYDHQPLAHGLEHRPDHGEQPVLGVRPPRRLRVQPGLAQSAGLPHRRRGGRYRWIRCRWVHPRSTGGLDRPGDPGRERRLPDRSDRRNHSRVPSAWARVREPWRLVDGPRLSVRLRSGPCNRWQSHCPDDRRGLPAISQAGRTHGALRRVPRESGADASGAGSAPCCGGWDRRGTRATACARCSPAGMGRGV